jgi:hypothetical protein
MASHITHSLIRHFTRILSIAFAIILLLSILSADAQAQTGHTWNGFTGAEDATYDGSRPSSGYSAISYDAISGDGRFITFYSSKTNIVPGKTTDYTDAFVRDRWMQQTELISIGMNGIPADGPSDRPAISANGRHIAFLSKAANLVPGDTNGDWDLFVRDRLLGTTSLVSVGPSGEQARNMTGAYNFYNLSADGRYIAFVAAFNPNSSDLFVWLRDRDTDGNGVFDEPGGTVTTQISPSAVGRLDGWGIYRAAISGNGRIIAYNSTNTQNGTNGRLFAYDRETGLTKRIDAPAPGLSDAAGKSFGADLDNEGRYLVYTSTAPNIVVGDGDTFEDLFLFDFQTGTNMRLRLSHPGAPSLQMWSSPSISGDGRFVTVMGALIPYGSALAFVLDLQTGSSREIKFIDNGTPDANPYYGVSGTSISADGSSIAFMDCGDTSGYWEPSRKVFVAIDLSLSINSIDIPQQGGSFSFNVTAPENTAWTVRTLWPDRIQVVDPANGVGAGQAAVSVLPNDSGIDGNIFVYVGSEKVQINQPSLSTILSVTPSSGPMAGGTVVQITGRAFTQGTTVTFGGFQATDVTILDSSTIQATTPPVAQAGSVEVVVLNTDGSLGRMINGFKYEDSTPPVVTAKLNGTLGNNGWYIGNVEVTWEVSDPESQIEYISGCESAIVSYDTFLTLSCTARSLGGTTTESVDIKIDTTPPQIYIDVPRQGGSYTHDAQVTTRYACIDSSNGSGTVECNGPVVSDSKLNTSEPGTYIFSVTARDAVGNQSTAEVSYTIVKRIPNVFWQTPSAILYGMPLSGMQLNAMGDVPGTYIYTPSAGTILPAGTHTLSVSFVPNDPAGNATVSRSVQLTVQKAIPATSWGSPASIVYGTPLSATQLNAHCSLPGTFTYTPPAGTILSAGTYTLTATFTPVDTANYVTTSRTVSITVQKATPPVTWDTPDNIVYGTPLDATQLNATANVAGTFAYTPAAGTILSAGTQTLMVSFEPTDSANYLSATKSVSISVQKAIPVISWTSPGSIAYGTPLSLTQLNATASVPGTFTYTPAAGTILGAGTYTLNVTFVPNDAANYETSSASVSLTVNKAYPVITWPDPASILYGTPISETQLNATANIPGTLTYTPAAGTILPAGSSQLSVEFVPDDSANYQTRRRQVWLTIRKATPVLSWATPDSIEYNTPLGSMQLNATADVAGLFNYVPAAGTILPAGTRELTVVFYPDSGNYQTTSKTVSLTVQKATPTVNWYPLGLYYGTPLGASQLNASSSTAGTFTYTPAAGTILPAGPTVLSLTFVPNDTANYSTVNKSVNFTISKAIPTVSWATPANIVYGTPLGAAQLNATASVPGTFSYSPDFGTILSAGVQGLSLIFVPNDSANYSTVNKSVSISVSKAIPTVSWATPGRIVYGTPLSAAQLNATANMAGTFAYTPALGTILRPPGTHPLSVVFTPSDTVNYSQANASVALILDPAYLTVQADNTSKAFGQALPAFTATITGFVAGDGMESLNGVLSFTTSATQMSAPGTYSVMPGGLSAQCYVVISTPGYLTIAKASTSTTLSTTPNPSANRQTVQLIAAVAAIAPGAGIPSGSIQFLDNGTALGTVPLINGVATMSMSFRKGTHSLTAVCAGDGNFTGSSGLRTQQVR